MVPLAVGFEGSQLWLYGASLAWTTVHDDSTHNRSLGFSLSSVEQYFSLLALCVNFGEPLTFHSTFAKHYHRRDPSKCGAQSRIDISINSSYQLCLAVR